MRLIGFVIAVAAAATCVPAHAEWQEHMFADLGIRKDFPDPPARTMGTYDSGLMGKVPSTILTAREPGSIYQLTVVDIPKARVEDSASLMSECNYNAMLAGSKVIADMSAEIGLGKAGVYGRWASVNHANGNRVLTACYSIRGRLYEIQTTITPQNADYPNSPDAFRFVNALDFNMDPNRDVPRQRPPAGGAPAAAPPARAN
jgi:hypothetical protein